MTFDFYTKHAKFSIGEKTFSKNGEVIATGDIFIFQLLLGYPAMLIIISENEFCPPTIIKTEPITSVLPEWEFFDGEQRPYKYTFEVLISSEGRFFTKLVSAVDQEHARQLMSLQYGINNIISIRYVSRKVKSYG